MSVPEYVRRRNSTMFVGAPPFGYACTDDCEGNACAFWHPPDVPPCGMKYHESSHLNRVPQESRQSPSTIQSWSDGIRSVDTVPCLFSSPKLSPDFVEHFDDSLNTVPMTLGNDLEGSQACTGKKSSMAVDSSPPAGQSLGRVRGDTAEYLAGKRSEGNRRTPQPQLGPIFADGEDDIPLLCSHGSPAPPLMGYSRFNAFIRCLIVAAFLSGCLLITRRWCVTNTRFPATVYLLKIAARTRAFVPDQCLRESGEDGV
jgi:hypothetical protein